MIYRAYYKGEYVMFEFEWTPLDLIRTKRKLDTLHLMSQYRTDLDKVMDDYMIMKPSLKDLSDG